MVRRSTWILLGVLAAIVVAYAGWQRFAPAPEPATPTGAPASPWAVLPEQVESIRIANLAQPAVVVAKRDPQEGWRMLAPVVGAADVGRIEAALAGVLAPSVRQTIDGATDLEAFGLAPAQYRLTLLLVDGTARSMDVGAIDPTGSVFYAQVPGEDRVLLVSRFSLEDLLGMTESPPYPLATETPTVEPGATATP
jgi:hypothetical protein